MATSSSGRQRTTLCVFYEKGWCKSGINCRFTHGTSDKRELLGAGTEGPPGAVASISGPCKFFARGKCSRGQKCPFLHSRYSADENHRRRTIADDRPAKRPAPDGFTPSRTASRHELTAWTSPPEDDDHLVSDGPTVASIGGGLPSPSVGGGGSSSSGSRTAGKGDGDAEGWFSANSDTAYFFGAPGGFDETGGSAGVSVPPATTTPAAAARMASSWRDVITRSPEPSAEDFASSTGQGSLAAEAAASAFLASFGARVAVPQAADTRPAPNAPDAAERSMAAVSVAVNNALSAPRVRERKPCIFFLRGCCRFGDDCRHSHGTPDRRDNALPGRKAVAVDAEEGDEQQDGPTEEEDFVAKEAALDEAERIQSRRAECGVCLERVKDRFGILVGCRHVYCLKCIRAWRARSENRECPQCRVPSHFVVPSAILITDPERKERLVKQYKESLAAIPCQHFEFGVSECPFGSSCFYAHLKKDGTPAYPSKPRIRLGASGESEAMRDVYLSSFFDPRL